MMLFKWISCTDFMTCVNNYRKWLTLRANKKTLYNIAEWQINKGGSAQIVSRTKSAAH